MTFEHGRTLFEDHTHQPGAHRHDLGEVAIPRGLITLWYGVSTAVPTGWAICNGTNGTPDLRGRVPVGVDTGQVEFDTLGETGGVKTATAEVAAHNHTQNGHSHSHGHTTQVHSHTVNAHAHGGGTGVHGHTSAAQVGTTTTAHQHRGVLNEFAGPPDGAAYFTAEATIASNSVGQTNTSETPGTSSPAVTVDSDASSSTATNQAVAGGAAHNNLQPYCAIHFIMKT